MSRCTSCGTDLSGDDACPICGTAVPTHRCERCGELFQGDACSACGAAAESFPCARHPERTAGGRCVVCGRALCRDCRRGDSRAFRCDEHAGVNVIHGWAQVYSTTRDFEAQLLSDNLQAEGVDSRIFSQRDHMISVDVGELSIVRLLVPVWEYERALQVIREHMDESGEVSFACPECGEAYDPGSDKCASCGAVLA